MHTDLPVSGTPIESNSIQLNNPTTNPTCVNLIIFNMFVDTVREVFILKLIEKYYWFVAKK